MAAERYTFDTNILFYSLDPADPAKHARARRIIGLADSRRVSVLLQTLGELSNAVAKRNRPMLSKTERLIQIASATFAIVPMELGDLLDALLIHSEHKLQFWDAVLWATARRAGCTTLFTEDMQDGRTLGGVAIRNPFNMSEKDLDEYFN